MEEAQEILLNSLANSGVTIPQGVSSIQELTPSSFVSICSQSLRLIHDTLPVPTSFPLSLPAESMADRFNISMDLASAFRSLGFLGDLSFHKFLYPTEEDYYMLVRFLVEKLGELTGGGTTIDKTDGMDGAKVKDKMVDLNYQEVGTKLNQLSLKTEASGFKDDFVFGSQEAYFMPQQFYEQKLSSLKEQYCQIGSEIEKLQSQEEIHWGNAVVEAEEGMEFDNQHSVNFCVKQLNEMMDAESRNLAELESEWNYLKLLEEKRRNLEESLYAANPEAQVKLQKLKEIKLEMQCIITEIREREEEHSKLAEDIKKQPKFSSRRSYIERVTEITKNSRKQDADIERILKETRELQLESNSIQESLLRTYAVVDETVFREAKRDPVARQAYRLLTGIHESFEQISEKIRATDKARREVAEYEAKLVAVVSRSLNIDKLQADLDAIRKENEHLESN